MLDRSSPGEIRQATGFRWNDATFGEDDKDAVVSEAGESSCGHKNK